MQLNNSSIISSESEELINNLLRDSDEELDQCFALLKYNEEKLEEINQLIRDLELKTDRDLEIFSPRNQSDLSLQLNNAIEEKELLLKENEKLTKRFEICSKRNDSLEQLKTRLQNNKHTFDKKKDICIDELQPDIKLLVLDIQEKERQRIARDLHDSSLQTLIHLIHKLELCSKYIDVDPVQANLEIVSCNKQLKKLINESRLKIFNLRPMSFDDLGFQEVLNRLKINLQEQSDMEIDFQIDQLESKEELILITIYRIIQEACNNAVKYSNGSKLSVISTYDSEQFYCRIEDNGIGFSMSEIEKKKNHFGIIMLQEQVKLLSGKIKIDSELGRGTTIEVYIPASVLKGVTE